MYNKGWYNTRESLYVFGVYEFNIYRKDTDEPVEKGFTTWIHAYDYTTTMLALEIIKSREEVYICKERIGK